MSPETVRYTQSERPYRMAHEMDLEERRALVIKDIVRDDEESRTLARAETMIWLHERLKDFMVYIDQVEQDGGDIYPERLDPEQARERFVEMYLEGIEDAESMESFDVPGWVPAGSVAEQDLERIQSSEVAYLGDEGDDTDGIDPRFIQS